MAARSVRKVKPSSQKLSAGTKKPIRFIDETGKGGAIGIIGVKKK